MAVFLPKGPKVCWWREKKSKFHSLLALLQSCSHPEPKSLTDWHTSRDRHWTHWDALSSSSRFLGCKQWVFGDFWDTSNSVCNTIVSVCVLCNTVHKNFCFNATLFTNRWVSLLPFHWYQQHCFTVHKKNNDPFWAFLSRGLFKEIVVKESSMQFSMHTSWPGARVLTSPRGHRGAVSAF